MKTKSIKTTLTVCVVATLAWLGATPAADARPPSGYGHSASRIYVNGYCSCGLPLYTERYFIGYDCHGRPQWGYRQVNRHYHQSYRPSHCGPIQHRSYDDSRRYHDRGGYGGYRR
jgi:hypothetical protein